MSLSIVKHGPEPFVRWISSFTLSAFKISPLSGVFGVDNEVDDKCIAILNIFPFTIAIAI